MGAVMHHIEAIAATIPPNSTHSNIAQRAAGVKKTR